MTKTDLIARIHEKTGLSRKDVGSALDALGAVIAESVSTGGTVPIPGLGKVIVRESAERTVRNPKTGENFVKPAGKAVKVSISKSLKDLVSA